MTTSSVPAGDAMASTGSPCALSVVTAVRNGEPYMRDQLEALAAQVCSFPWELVVVDNGSTDSTAAIAESFAGRIPGLRVLSEPTTPRDRQARAFALNAGVQAARGAKVVFVDHDDVVAPGYLQAMADGLDRLEMVSGNVDTDRLNPPWAREKLLPLDRLNVFLGFLPYIPGSLLGVRATVFQRIGLFATDRPFGSDVDFVWRAQLSGIKADLAPGAVLHYRRAATVKGNFGKARLYARTQVCLYAQYRRLGQRRRPWREVASQLRRMAATAARHRPHWLWSFAYDVGDLLGHLEQSVREGVWYI
jgi:glycosyltransferase involved in cell wall biosynthesis